MKLPRSDATPAAPRRLRKALCLVVVAASGTLAVGGAPLVAGAAPPDRTTFKLTGGVNGTLTMPNRRCQGADSKFSFAGQALAQSQSDVWSVFVTTPDAQGGTWKKFGRTEAEQGRLGVVLQTQSSSGANEWIIESGTLRTSRGTGSLNGVLGFETSYDSSPSGPVIHVSGSWGCTRRS
ncbi:MAG: hypothetical protein ACLPVF_09225 [Acidimicrobiales bacterium]